MIRFRRVEGPDRLDHRPAVRVEQELPPISVARQVELPHQLARDAASGAPGHGGQEFPLRHGGVLVGEVRGDVLQQDAPAEDLLRLVDPLGDVAVVRENRRIDPVGQGFELTQIVC